MNTDKFFKKNKILLLIIVVIVALGVSYLYSKDKRDQELLKARQDCIGFARVERIVKACEAKYPIK